MAGEVAVLTDPADLALLLGPLPDLDAARATLEAGGAVVLQPNTVDPQGKVWLQPSVLDVNGAPTPSPAFAVPAVEVLSGALPSLGDPRAEGARARAAPPRRCGPSPASQVVYVQPRDTDRADRPTAADAISIGLAKARVSGVAVGAADTSVELTDRHPRGDRRGERSCWRCWPASW